MIVRCESCGALYNDEHCWTLCPHGPLWAGPKAYCKKHDLVDCLFYKGGEDCSVTPTEFSENSSETSNNCEGR